MATAVQVHHTSVSRFFRACQGAGYLDSQYMLTKDGRIWYDTYLSMREGLRRYCNYLGMEEGEAEENVELFFESMRPDSIQKMVDSISGESIGTHGANRGNAPSKTQEGIASVIRKGEYGVDFRVLRAKPGKNGKRSLSMADRGFFHPAKIKKNNRGTFVELTAREIQAISQITGIKMRGRLSAFHYLQHDYDCSVRIRDGKIVIPLEAFEFRQGILGDMVGVLPIKVRCNVGQLHMPESRALLTIWL